MTMNQLRPIALAIALPTPNDGSSPPTPIGMPQHVAIDYSPTDPADVQPGASILYMIPVVAYQDLWAQHGDLSVSRVIQQLHTLLASDAWDPDLAVLDALIEAFRLQLTRACTSQQAVDDHADAPIGADRPLPIPASCGRVCQSTTGDVGRSCRTQQNA